MANNDPARVYAQNLVDTLKKKGDLMDATLEDAFLSVPRHLFLPDVPLEKVYEDEAIAIKRESDGSVLSSSSQPSMMALMLRQLKLRPGDNVLEIGTGTGYNAAIMQYLVGETGSVTTVELDKELAHQARIHLQHARIGNNVTVVDADGAMGYAPRASYDRIIATAGIWDIPPAWIKQLKDNGILVAPIWIEGGQVSAAFTLQPDGSLYSARNLPCGFITLRGIAAGPNLLRRVSSSGLLLSTSEANRLDGAAIHLLLSEDAETNRLTLSMTADDYWNGFAAYLAIRPPEGYLFAQYAVGENQQSYGLEGSGFAIITAGSACFVPYHGVGVPFVRRFGCVSGDAGFPRRLGSGRPPRQCQPAAASAVQTRVPTG
ncbi:MAG: methyltransferase domain-containing protein [Anaerolineae bacterium]|nr:methyltransferase domain-containing protein [Anaerolineae bacterium]